VAFHFYVEAKFGPLEKGVKTIDTNRDEIFQNSSRIRPFLPQRNVEILEELKAEPDGKKLSGYRSNWLRLITRMSNNRMPKIILSYRPNGRRRLGRPLKRLLDEGRNRSIKD
jgi:hypothetical protein